MLGMLISATAMSKLTHLPIFEVRVDTRSAS
jgi:hypothetical protein